MPRTSGALLLSPMKRTPPSPRAERSLRTKSRSDLTVGRPRSCARRFAGRFGFREGLRNDRQEEAMMDHAATVRRFYGLLSDGDIDGFGDMLTDDFVEHEETPGLAPTKDGVLEFFRIQRAAFPDMRLDPEDVLVDGDKVVARARMTGTHEGELMGMPPTGKSVDVQLIDIIRFGDDGLAHEHWGVFDLMAMMQQLGAVPDGPPA
jgi:steroid delta-isomerase-like uncharacterized protein